MESRVCVGGGGKVGNVGIGLEACAGNTVGWEETATPVAAGFQGVSVFCSCSGSRGTTTLENRRRTPSTPATDAIEMMTDLETRPMGKV